MGNFEAKLEAGESDEAWAERQLESTPGPDEGYTDDQFAQDLDKACAPLKARAQRARKAMEQGTAKPFPR